MDIGIIGGGASHIWANTELDVGCIFDKTDDIDEPCDEIEDTLAYYRAKDYDGPIYKNGCTISSCMF